MHFSCSGPGSVSLLIHSLEERSCRLLLGCRAFCAKWIYELPQQLRQMSPGAEVVRTAMQDWQTNMMTCIATKRGWERQNCEQRMDWVRVRKLFMTWPSESPLNSLPTGESWCDDGCDHSSSQTPQAASAALKAWRRRQGNSYPANPAPSCTRMQQHRSLLLNLCVHLERAFPSRSWALHTTSHTDRNSMFVVMSFSTTY